MAIQEAAPVPAPATGSAPIRLVNLTKRFGEGVLAVDNLSLEVEQGMVFGLLGPNGAGKTTALRMMLGLIYPTSGESYLFGELMRPSSKVLSRVGCLVEGPGFVPHLSGIENLRLYWTSTGSRWEDANIDEALAIADLGNAIHRKVRTYSKGMTQRLGLAQVLLNKPELLVLDEPTIGLDPGEMRDVRDLVRRLSATGATVLLSSHILAEVEQICTHAAIINRGRLVVTGTVDSLIGETGTVYLEVDDVDRALAVLKSVPGVPAAEPEPPGISIALSERQRQEVVAALVNAGVGVRTVMPRRRLEDAFIGIVEGEPE
ncbi:MAG: ABC transporter ATP-binding protein [Chloroflexota bacterium]